MNDQAMQLIEQLAAKLGVASEHIWKVMIRQSVIYGWGNLCLTAIFAVLIATIWCVVSKRIKKEDCDEGEVIGFYVIMSAISVIYILASSCSLVNNITAIINQEFWALERILQAIK